MGKFSSLHFFHRLWNGLMGTSSSDKWIGSPSTSPAYGPHLFRILFSHLSQFTWLLHACGILVHLESTRRSNRLSADFYGLVKSYCFIWPSGFIFCLFGCCPTPLGGSWWRLTLPSSWRYQCIRQKAALLAIYPFGSIGRRASLLGWRLLANQGE